MVTRRLDDTAPAEELFLEDSVNASMVSSWISAASAENCFMADSLFKIRLGPTDIYLPGEQLGKGSCVVAHDNRAILEVVREPERYEVDKIVEMRAGDATQRYTPDHRVHALRRGTGEPCDVQARDLRPMEDCVFVDGNPTVLASVEEKVLATKVSVLKITFKPDMAVAVFTPPPAISTKGSKKKPLRRGGRRPQPNDSDHEHLSIPDTAPGEYQD